MVSAKKSSSATTIEKTTTSLIWRAMLARSRTSTRSRDWSGMAVAVVISSHHPRAIIVDQRP